MTQIPFVKMQGAGNDFAVIDNRKAAYKIDAQWAKAVADRRFGVGCDQFIVLEPSKKADVFMRIYNPDGSESNACGNATRAIGWQMMRELSADMVTIETKAGLLKCHSAGEATVRVDMGEPKLDWTEIPLSESRNTEHLGIEEGGLMNPVAVNMGNPHMVFFVADLNYVNLAKSGPVLEKNPLFTSGANVSAAQVIDGDHIKLQVWERGAGLTLACGTAACATLVAAVRRGLTARKATIQLPGGDLLVEWGKDNHVQMTGPVAVVFEGSFDKGLVL